MTGNKTESGNAPGFISVDETPIKYTGTEGKSFNNTHTMPVIEERISAESGAKPSYKISQYITDYLYSTQEQTPSVLLSPYTTSKTDSGENLSIYTQQCGEFGSNLGTAHCPAGSFCVPGGVGGSCPDNVSLVGAGGVVINQVLKNSDGKISAADKMQCTYCCTGQEVEGTGCKQCDTGYFKPDPQTGGAECSICNSNEQVSSLTNPYYVNFQKTTCNSCTLQDNYYYSPNPQGLCTVNSNDGPAYNHGCCPQEPKTWKCTDPDNSTCTLVSNSDGYALHNEDKCKENCKPPPKKDNDNPKVKTADQFNPNTCDKSKTGYYGFSLADGICIPVCDGVTEGQTCSDSELGYTCTLGSTDNDIITCGGIGLDLPLRLKDCPNDMLQKLTLVGSESQGYLLPIPNYEYGKTCGSGPPEKGGGEFGTCNPNGSGKTHWYGRLNTGSWLGSCPDGSPPR
jgi:hypothetical protein